jgi:hypothetical protein
VSKLERSASHCYPNIRSFEEKGRRVDNTVKASLTLTAPIMRQMETSSRIVATIRATLVPTATTSEIDTHRIIVLAFAEMQRNTNLKLRNNI